MNAAPDRMTFKVFTLNTHKGFTPFNRRFVLPELREAVRGIHADVVFLQEVLGSHTSHAERHDNWPDVPHYEFLADTIWTDFAYGRNAVYTEGHHGNAVLSKYPILSWHNRDVSINGPEQRGLLHCVLKSPLDGVVIHTICAHLSLTEGHRQQQYRRLCEFIAEVVPPTAPLIVAGDFNDWR
ncbi:MAG: endonuclease/exonuclease/phosphatase family protein, partial [Pseudomonas sp.]